VASEVVVDEMQEDDVLSDGFDDAKVKVVDLGKSDSGGEFERGKGSIVMTEVEFEDRLFVFVKVYEAKREGDETDAEDKHCWEIYWILCLLLYTWSMFFALLSSDSV
jgi:hypothetical protein